MGQITESLDPPTRSAIKLITRYPVIYTFCLIYHLVKRISMDLSIWPRNPDGEKDYIRYFVNPLQTAPLPRVPGPPALHAFKPQITNRILDCNALPQLRPKLELHNQLRREDKESVARAEAGTVELLRYFVDQIIRETAEVCWTSFISMLSMACLSVLAHCVNCHKSISLLLETWSQFTGCPSIWLITLCICLTESKQGQNIWEAETCPEICWRRFQLDKFID